MAYMISTLMIRVPIIERISDIFTRGENPFIVVFDVTIEGQQGRVLVINKNKILWVSPED